MSALAALERLLYAAFERFVGWVLGWYCGLGPDEPWGEA